MEINGKHYTVNIKDFAAENGVSVRTVQKKLVAEKYKKDLEGEFIRTNADGTWLTDEACRFLKTTFKTQAIGFVSDSKLEAENNRLRQELDDANAEFRKYASDTAAMLALASKQVLLAEQSEANQKRAEEAEVALRALNDDLNAEKKKVGELTLEVEKAQNEANLARLELEEYMALPWYKKIKRKQKGK